MLAVLKTSVSRAPDIMPSSLTREARHFLAVITACRQRRLPLKLLDQPLQRPVLSLGIMKRLVGHFEE